MTPPPSTSKRYNTVLTASASILLLRG
jgi:hypothetical protein